MEEILYKRRTNTLTLDTKGKVTKKMQDYKKRSFSSRFSINVFYSPISLSFPLHRCLCSARGRNVFPFSSALVFHVLPTDVFVFFFFNIQAVMNMTFIVVNIVEENYFLFHM